MLAYLAGRDILSLLVEGGPILHQAFIEAGLVDRVQRVVTPHELGTGVPAEADWAERLALTMPARHVMLGPDEMMEADVHRTD